MQCDRKVEVCSQETKEAARVTLALVFVVAIVILMVEFIAYTLHPPDDGRTSISEGGAFDLRGRFPM